MVTKIPPRQISKHMEIGKNNIGENEYFMTSNNVKHSLATTDKQTDLGVIID